jgi:DNA-binding GntR family transcriptional regulator
MMLRATTLSQPGRLEESCREIAAIVEAVQRNDPAGAAKACRNHVENAEKLAMKALTAKP